MTDRNSPQKHVWRAQIVLLTSDHLVAWIRLADVVGRLAVENHPAFRERAQASANGKSGRAVPHGRTLQPSINPRISTVPFKADADRRQHIPKPRRRVTNGSEYDAGLRQRGSLTFWFTGRGDCRLAG
jgi:hypothetical protein